MVAASVGRLFGFAMAAAALLLWTESARAQTITDEVLRAAVGRKVQFVVAGGRVLPGVVVSFGPEEIQTESLRLSRTAVFAVFRLDASDEAIAEAQRQAARVPEPPEPALAVKAEAAKAEPPPSPPPPLESTGRRPIITGPPKAPSPCLAADPTATSSANVIDRPAKPPQPKGTHRARRIVSNVLMAYGYGSFATLYLESALIGATKLDGRFLIPVIGTVYLKDHETGMLTDFVVYSNVTAQAVGLVIAVVGTALWATTPADPPKPGDRVETLALVPWATKDSTGLALAGIF